jgi:threonine dehydrogenase-like Zn-dependent dehydrogenase
VLVTLTHHQRPITQSLITETLMKAIAVIPGTPNSVHLAEMPMPSIDDVPGGRGVLVKILRVGVDGTDKEINAAEYGKAPPGYRFLTIGHESFGRVITVGDRVTELRAGDYVVPSVRRPGTSIYDLIGMEDMTTDDRYFERGISELHGFLTEYVVDSADYFVKLPASLQEVGVLLEPLTVVEKGIAQAYEVQRRLRVWKPKRVAVIGAGTIGLLAALVLRLRGLDVTSFALGRKPNLNAELVEALGVRYVSVADSSIRDDATKNGRFDMIIEASGYSPAAFESMRALSKNGILVLVSVTGGMRTAEVPADVINFEFVLGNKAMIGSVNASHADFESGVRDLVHAESQFPGWLGRLLTHPVKGLENFIQLFETLEHGKNVIKCYCEVAATAEARTPGARSSLDARVMAIR